LASGSRMLAYASERRLGMESGKRSILSEH